MTLFLARVAGWLIRAYLRHDSISAPGGSIFVNLARLVIWAVGITFMLGIRGVRIGPLVASLGVVGLAVSLGLQDTLANFFSGLQITNFTAGDEQHTLAIPFTVAFGSDLDAVKFTAEKVARAVRDAHETALNDFEPTCRFRAFGPDGVSANVTITGVGVAALRPPA